MTAMKYNKKDYMLLIKEATALYEASRDDKLADFPMSEREKFHKNGNREDFEKLYFKRRDYLSSAAILALFDKTYIPELQRILLAVCDEYCWALPAHTNGNEADDKRTLDLFVAETSFALAEICTVFRDEISSDVYDRVKAEIKARLLDNYRNNTYWWESCRMNWASVCGGYIGGALLYLFPEEFAKHKSRILKTLDCYIDGFTDDGFCLEGPSYWQYGFMAYAVFADLLYKFSGGKDDLFLNDKVKKIASYGSNTLLKGKTALSFSDADMSFIPDYALQCFLHKKLPCAVPCPDISYGPSDSNTKWIDYYRAIIWRCSDGAVQTNKADTVYSSDANQLIVNREKYSFAFKGGNNGEPHNHNDLGSFIYSDKEGQIFCDLGSGRYTKDYFDDCKRYGIFCNSSLSHNVPIINGKSQPYGKDFSAKITYENNLAVCDMTNAYDETELTSLIRRTEIKEDGIVLTDSFIFTQAIPVTERFVTLKKAQIKEGELIFGETRMLFPANRVTLSLKEENHTPHEYGKADITVYCYDFLLKDGAEEISFRIKTR